MKKALLTLAVLFSFAANTLAQNNWILFECKVVFSETKEPIPYADIVVMSGTDTVSVGKTDSVGHYVSLLTPGRYSIIFSSDLCYESVMILENDYSYHFTFPTIELGGAKHIRRETIMPIAIGNPNSAMQQLEIEGVPVKVH